ncbi:hypothetical protein F5Y16DRAFT_397247 [Xylariaceae sp. FL0255]|nr:hypothetical protein F5Y16DRAFT_397247 [Xylariaceae sp. FL0255]
MPSYGVRLEILGATKFVEGLFEHMAPIDTLNGDHYPLLSDVQTPPGIEQQNNLTESLSYPPGLIRPLPPKRTSPRMITNSDVSLFSDFSPCLNAGYDVEGNPVIIELTCSICQESPLSVYDTMDGVEGCEALVVLPCGHFFGKDCFITWAESMVREDGDLPTCPLCRFKLGYSCGHIIPGKTYLPNDLCSRQIPLTVPEGGSVPLACESCVADEIYLSLDHLRALIFPSGIENGNFRGYYSQDGLRFAAMEFEIDIQRYMVRARSHYLRW